MLYSVTHSAHRKSMPDFQKLTSDCSHRSIVFRNLETMARIRV